MFCFSLFSLPARVVTVGVLQVKAEDVVPGPGGIKTEDVKMEDDDEDDDDDDDDDMEEVS